MEDLEVTINLPCLKLNILEDIINFHTLEQLVFDLSEPLRLDTLSLNTPCIPESYSLPITSRIPLEADNPKRNATSSYYTHLL